MSERTIAAIATSLGESSIGVVRISGDSAITIADRVFFSFSKKKLCELKGYQALYGQIKDKETVLDDAVALVFRAPKSYTGENVVEISIHGGRFIIRSVLRLILDNGAVMAEPGEFTKLAFLNGKLDLTEAESVMGLISASNESQLKISRAAHTGKISIEIEKIEKNLVSADASIAAFSDYPDEEIEGLNYNNFMKMLVSSSKALNLMLKNYDAGKALREGIDTVIVGKPNVGKSTLMNMLSGFEKSIVTNVAGTTRDIIEDTVTVGDIVLKLADTAGIHKTDDIVESIGVERAKSRTETAGLILGVFDSTQPLDNDDIELLNSIKDKTTIIIINKTDIVNKIDMSVFENLPVVLISAKEGTGYNELSMLIKKVSGTALLDPDSAILLCERQRACAKKALDAVNEAIVALSNGCTLDAVGVCVDDAISALYELSGKRVTNEVTNEIFKKFCVGK